MDDAVSVCEEGEKEMKEETKGREEGGQCGEGGRRRDGWGNDEDTGGDRYELVADLVDIRRRR